MSGYNGGGGRYSSAASGGGGRYNSASSGGGRYGTAGIGYGGGGGTAGEGERESVGASGGGGRYASAAGGYGGSAYGGKDLYGNGLAAIGGKQLGSKLRTIDWARVALVEFQKDFYQEHENVARLSAAAVEAFRTKHEITISGQGVPNPIMSFEESCFPEYLLAEVYKAGFIKPTPIQSQGWPMALSGRDMVGVAETGSGKTLSFLLPAIVHINAQPLLKAGEGPIVLVLAPTRELAIQIMGECEKFGKSSRIKFSCVYGGVPKKEQAKKLKDGV